jgi:hypothetical protein
MAQDKNAKSSSSDWRELCVAAATEQDSTKLTNLVDQLIKALDERTPRLRRAGEIDLRSEF